MKLCLYKIIHMIFGCKEQYLVEKNKGNSIVCNKCNKVHFDINKSK
jgi:hypothetical protein